MSQPQPSRQLSFSAWSRRTTLLEESLIGAAGRWAIAKVCEHGATLNMTLAVHNGREPGDPWHHFATLEIEVCLSHPASCTVNGRTHSWSFAESPDGPLDDAIWWTMHQLWDTELIEVGDVMKLDFGVDEERAHATRRRIREICELAAARALELADAVACGLVRRLPKDVGFFTYGALLEDPDGRIQQMIKTCPCLLTLAAAGNPHGPRVRSLLGGIRAGKKLSRLIDEALPLGLEHHCPAGSSTRLSRHASALVRALPETSLDSLLNVLYAPGLDINDLVAAGASRGAWIQTMIGWGHCARKIDDRAAAMRLGGFLSRHALELQQMDIPGLVIEEIMDWLDGTGAAAPGRSSSPKRVREAIDDWHANLYRHVEFPPETPLVSGPVTKTEIIGIDVMPIATVRQLVDEGSEMHHCVASFASAAIAGEVFFYKVTVAGVRLTIALTGQRGRWFVREVSGFANRSPDPDELAPIERWVEALP